MMLREFSGRIGSSFRRTLVGTSVLVVAALVASVPGSPQPLDGLRKVSDRAAATLAAITNPPETDRFTSTNAVARMMRFRRATFDARPAPEPSPTEAPVVAAAPAPAPPPVADPGSIEAIIIAAAEEFGVDANMLLNLARCESGLNPRAVNPAGYHGLFQFSPSTWAANGYGDIYDPVAQSRTTARMISQGGIGHWGNCA